MIALRLAVEISRGQGEGESPRESATDALVERAEQQVEPIGFHR